MTVTELALLHLTTGTTLDDATLCSSLSHAKTVMQNYTGHTFYYMQQTEDPSCIYIIGEWDSLDQHMNEFIPSPENQALLQSLTHALVVDKLEHVDVANANLPLPTSPAQLEQARRGELVWSIVHCNVKAGERRRFLDAFNEELRFLQGHVPELEGKTGRGWCLGGKGDEGNVSVALCPWKSVEQHLGLGKTEGYADVADVGDFIDGRDVRHAKLLDI